MVTAMGSGLRKAATNLMDAETYLEKINALGLGTYRILDGWKFPEYMEIQKEGGGDRRLELPVIPAKATARLCDLVGMLLNQIEPHLKNDEADIYVQRVAWAHVSY